MPRQMQDGVAGWAPNNDAFWSAFDEGEYVLYLCDLSVVL